MEKLSKEAENLIIESVSRVNELVNQGNEPTEAAIKTAEEKQLQPGYIQLVAQAYNIGATNEHRSLRSNVLDKSASFALIDPLEVLRVRYPSEVKSAGAELMETAVAAEYDSPPKWIEKRTKMASTYTKQACVLTEKRAEAYEEDPTKELRKQYATHEKASKAAQAARTEMSRCYNNVVASTDAVRLHFKQAASLSSYNTVKTNCILKYGNKVEPLFARLNESNPEFAKRASAKAVFAPATGAVYKLVAAWVEKVAAFAEARAKFLELEKQAQQTTVVKSTIRAARPMHVLDGVVPLFKESAATSEVETEQHPTVAVSVLHPQPAKGRAPIEKKASAVNYKRADQLPWMHRTTSLLRQTAPLFARSPATGSVEDALGKAQAKRLVYDPTSENRIQALRTHALLQDMLMNDDVISGYDPGEVASAFNELHNFAPEVARQPATARAFLRKHLAQGQVDPYDLDLAAGMENKLRKRDEQHLSVQFASPEQRRLRLSSD